MKMSNSPYREHIAPEIKRPLSDEEIEERLLNDLTTTGKIVDQIKEGRFNGKISDAIYARIAYNEAISMITMFRCVRGMERITKNLEEIERKLK